MLRFGEIRQGVYGAAKAGLIALARTVAKEHGRHGIRSNVICPGLVLPESDEAVGIGSLWAAGTDSIFNDKQIESLVRGIPLRRLTTAADIADAGSVDIFGTGCTSSDRAGALSQWWLFDAMSSTANGTIKFD